MTFEASHQEPQPIEKEIYIERSLGSSGTAFLSRTKLLRPARPSSPLARGRKASASCHQSQPASSVALEILTLVQGVMPKVRQPLENRTERPAMRAMRMGSPRGAVLQGAIGQGMKVAGQHGGTHRHDGSGDERWQPAASLTSFAVRSTALGWAGSSPGRAGQILARSCHTLPS